MIVGANRRLEHVKSPAAMLQENNPQTPHAHMSIPRMYVPGILYQVLEMYLVLRMYVPGTYIYTVSYTHLTLPTICSV